MKVSWAWSCRSNPAGPSSGLCMHAPLGAGDYSEVYWPAMTPSVQRFCHRVFNGRRISSLLVLKVPWRLLQLSQLSVFGGLLQEKSTLSCDERPMGGMFLIIRGDLRTQAAVKGFNVSTLPPNSWSSHDWIANVQRVIQGPVNDATILYRQPVGRPTPSSWYYLLLAQFKEHLL